MKESAHSKSFTEQVNKSCVQCVSENGLHPVTWLTCSSGKAITYFLTYIDITNKFVPLKFCNLGWYRYFAWPMAYVHSDTNSTSPGSILARQQLRAKNKSLTFPPLSIARYTFIQLSQLGRQCRERKCPIFGTVAKRDSNLRSLDCESGVLSLSYRASHCCLRMPW